jgi:hypothetical protein
MDDYVGLVVTGCVPSWAMVLISVCACAVWASTTAEYLGTIRRCASTSNKRTLKSSPLSDLYPVCASI